MINNRQFYNFPRITLAVYFTYFEGIVVLAEQVVSLKRLKTSAFESSEPLLRLMGVSVPSLLRESTDSQIYA